MAQHKNNISAQFNPGEHTIDVSQELTYVNTTTDTLNHIILNDWNNAYSDKTTPMAKRFTDEFIKAFHLAKDADRGNTTLYNFTDQNGLSLNWHRPEDHPDLVFLQLKNPIYPGKSFKITFNYRVKLPRNRFTRFGYDAKTEAYHLRDWYLTPARYENGFVSNSNENLDDIANAAADYNFTISVPDNYSLYCDLDGSTKQGNTYTFTGKSRMGFTLDAEKVKTTQVHKLPGAIIYNSIADDRVSDIEQAIIIDRVANFTAERLGKYPYEKILVSQADYERSPVYGLNQLPAFIRPFPDNFIFEIKFLKTYLKAYLRNTLKLDPRDDNWVYNFIETSIIINYIRDYHPNEKVTGNLGNWGILQGHHLFNIKQEDQFQYLYLFMSRKNLDQPIGNPKNSFIKFNLQIASAYKAAQGYKYLDDYVGNDAVNKAMKEFFLQNQNVSATNRNDFELALQQNTNKDISWFFNYIIDSRKVIDYKIGPVKKDRDSVTVTLKNVSGTPVPVSLYGVKKKEVVFKQWINAFENDTTLTLPRQSADRLALNYNKEMPEFNPRNNQRSLKGYFLNRRPYKFTFFLDLEDPDYNQIYYVPAFAYNLYDGLSPGLRLNNKSYIEKPFVFDVSGLYSPKTGQATGSASFMYNQYIREGSLYNVRYNLQGNTYHYAPDARYYRIMPSIQLRIRPDDYRVNQKEFLTLRQVIVQRDPSAYINTQDQNENYSVFNVRYNFTKSDIAHTNSFSTDVQLAGIFGKLSGEYQYRHLFDDNRQVNLRFFGGLFMYRDTSSEFFSFGLDRPSDYLFDYNFYGRSETTGLFSQQYVMADGGFKSMFDTRYANQWMTTVNGSFNIWNWIELYGDAGLMKNKYSGTKFLYDSGVRLNLVTDYFELYFPIQSSNGFEPSIGNYSQKIRFVVTLSPGTLISLFTRKWF
ncbi:aminopeptidase [Flavobacterium sp. RHBU_3]|uniref:aminopeptidase n=1 Tax=Flavobacterium sp. RHBU_3 TaxID=3391184 RepID=UPI0039850209